MFLGIAIVILVFNRRAMLNGEGAVTDVLIDEETATTRPNQPHPRKDR